jgi:hypothetical protein
MTIRQIAERIVAEGILPGPVEREMESLLEAIRLFGPQRIVFNDGSQVFAARYY